MAEPAHALLVIDAQAGLLNLEPVPEAAEVVDAIRALLDKARRAGALVVYLQNDGAPGSADEPGTPGWPIDTRLQPHDGDLVLRKADDDGFEGTRLAEALDSRAARRLAITGLLSEMCVSATARTALRRGYEVALVTDGHATYDLDEIPARAVARVAEHALGDQVEFRPAAEVSFAQSLVDDGGE